MRKRRVKGVLRKLEIMMPANSVSLIEFIGDKYAFNSKFIREEKNKRIICTIVNSYTMASLGTSLMGRQQHN